MNRVAMHLLTAAVGIAGLAQSTLAGEATVHIVWPCTPFDLVWSESLKPDYTVLVDGAPRLKITTCHHEQFSVSAGSHGFRIQHPGVDIGAMFGDGELFKLAPGDHLYFGVVNTYGGGAYLKDIGPAYAKELMAGIDRF